MITASFHLADITIDLMTQRIYRRGKLVHFHAQELRLLIYLCSKAPQPVSRRELFERCWGRELPDNPDLDTNTVQVHICRLRQHLGDAVRGIGSLAMGSGDIIETWPGGYRIVPEVTFSVSRH